MQTITVDALICGGGMSGLACASFAASSGAKVLVVEKQSTVGGSSNYSAGMLYVEASTPINYGEHVLITLVQLGPQVLLKSALMGTMGKSRSPSRLDAKLPPGRTMDA